MVGSQGYLLFSSFAGLLTAPDQRGKELSFEDNSMRSSTFSFNLRPWVLGSLLGLGLTACVQSAEKVEDSKPQSATEVKASKADCTDRSFCTREYLPTTCRFEKESFAASNRCEAMKLARRFACEKQLPFDEAKVDCSAQAAPGGSGQ